MRRRVARLRRVIVAARGDAPADLVLHGGRVVVEVGRSTVPARRALATSASHDAPNIVVAGLDERDMLGAVREVQRMQRDFEDDIRRKDREYTDRVLRDLAKIAQKIGEEGKYTIILEANQPAIVFISKGLDLTEEVIKQANSQKSK